MNDFPSFDQVEAAGLDGTLRTCEGSGPEGQWTWKDLALSLLSDEGHTFEA